MTKEQYRERVLFAAKLIGLQRERTYLEYYGIHNEELDDKIMCFIDKVSCMPKNQMGSRIGRQIQEKKYYFSEKQAYWLAKTAISNCIDL